MSDDRISERIRGQAAIASRAGQMAKLEDIAADVEALEAENARLRSEADAADLELTEFVDLITPLMHGTADALKGPPPPLMMHDWSDLPAVAATVIEERDAAEAKCTRLSAVVIDIGRAVRSMQSMHARLGTGDDPDEEAAFLSMFHEAVIDVLDLELPADLLALGQREATDG